MSDERPTEYMILTCNVRLDSDDPEFRRGIEFGMVYAAMNFVQGEFQVGISSENTEMLLRACRQHRRTHAGHYEGDQTNWMHVYIGAAGGG